MDSTLLIALLAATLSLLLFGVTVVLVSGLVLFFWRSRRSGSRVEGRAAASPVPFERAPTMVPPVVVAAAPSFPPPATNGGLLGFFDDESSAPGLDANRAGLFPSGGVGWPEDVSEEGEATEIFSAHSASADLAEFAFDEADEATGRFPKSNESR